MTERTRQLIYSFVLGLLLVAIPIAIQEMSVPVPNWSHLAWALLGGALGYTKKFLETMTSSMVNLHEEVAQKVAMQERRVENERNISE